MKKILSIVLLLFLLAPGLSVAAGPTIPLDGVKVNVLDREALRRGADLFIGYCMACHSAQYMRYTHVARDLGLTPEEVRESLIFTRTEGGDLTPIGDFMMSSLTEKDALAWFGTVPPDLTLTARLHGEDWLYTFMRSFYVDESRPFGTNNAVFKNIAMPHVMWELQGYQEKIGYEGRKPIFELIDAAGPTVEDYDAAVTDLVTFMAYLAEPIRIQRETIGPWVLLFLAGLTYLLYLLKKEYWKDVH